jgi:hypothetical protein
MKNQMESIRSINLFKSDSNAATDLRIQRFDSRIYLLLLISCLALTMMDSLVIQRTKAVTVQYPVCIDDRHLIEWNSEEVDCPCTRVSISNQEFVNELRVTAYYAGCRTSVIHSFLFSDGLEQLCRIAARLRFDSCFVTGQCIDSHVFCELETYSD